MSSRYDWMKDGNVLDTDDEIYPDPLSVRYNNYKVTKIPTLGRVSANDIAKFWIYMNNEYKIVDKYDLLLSINGIPYIGMLRPNDEVYNLDMDDIDNFNEEEDV